MSVELKSDVAMAFKLCNQQAECVALLEQQLAAQAEAHKAELQAKDALIAEANRVGWEAAELARMRGDEIEALKATVASLNALIYEQWPDGKSSTGSSR